MPDHLHLGFGARSPKLTGLEFDVLRKEHYILLKFDLPEEPPPLTAKETRTLRRAEERILRGMEENRRQPAPTYGKHTAALRNREEQLGMAEMRQRQAAKVIDLLMNQPHFSLVEDIPAGDPKAADISGKERSGAIFLAPAPGLSTQQIFVELAAMLRGMGAVHKDAFTLHDPPQQR